MPDHNINQATDKNIKIVDLSAGKTFIANGKKYKVSDSFSIGRLSAVSLLEEELSILGAKSDSLSIMVKAMEFINTYEPGEAYALLRNKVHSENNNIKLMHYSLRICTAYINYEDEDLRYLTEENIKEKLNDWSEEGLDVRPFFIFAKQVANTHLTNLDKDIQDILEKAATVKEMLFPEKDTEILKKETGN